MSDYYSTVLVSAGDMFDVGSSTVVVIRRSVRDGWVDIRVTDVRGATWTKRMPKGIPAEWRRSAR